MKAHLLLLYLITILSFSCDMRSREEALNEKEAQLNQKEQELLLREQSIRLREEEINRRADSTTFQQGSVFNDTLLGKWNVQMTCTETNCPGSAIGDTKTELWEIIFDSGRYIAKAMSDNKLVRIYSGTYNGSALELRADRDSSIASPNIIVRLTTVHEMEMRGQREITRENDCRIVYDIALKKQ